VRREGELHEPREHTIIQVSRIRVTDTVSHHLLEKPASRKWIPDRYLPSQGRKNKRGDNLLISRIELLSLPTPDVHAFNMLIDTVPATISPRELTLQFPTTKNWDDAAHGTATWHRTVHHCISQLAHSLVCVTLYLPKLGHEDKVGRTDWSMSFTHLGPLLQSPQLEEFTLSMDDLWLALNDENVKDMAMSWLRLRLRALELFFHGRPVEDQYHLPTPTVSSVYTLAVYCPDLQRLCIPLDVQDSCNDTITGHEHGLHSIYPYYGTVPHQLAPPWQMHFAPISLPYTLGDLQHGIIDLPRIGNVYGVTCQRRKGKTMAFTLRMIGRYGISEQVA
jgi:hypothetical protein